MLNFISKRSIPGKSLHDIKESVSALIGVRLLSIFMKTLFDNTKVSTSSVANVMTLEFSSGKKQNAISITDNRVQSNNYRVGVKLNPIRMSQNSMLLSLWVETAKLQSLVGGLIFHLYHCTVYIIFKLLKMFHLIFFCF